MVVCSDWLAAEPAKDSCFMLEKLLAQLCR